MASAPLSLPSSPGNDSISDKERGKKIFSSPLSPLPENVGKFLLKEESIIGYSPLLSLRVGMCALLTSYRKH